MAEANSGAVPKTAVKRDNAAGNDSDATVDYNPANKNRSTGGALSQENGARSSKSPDMDSLDNFSIQSLIRGNRRRRRKASRRNAFMRGYHSRSAPSSGTDQGTRRRPRISPSSGTEQSDALDGSDSNGRRVRRRVNCIQGSSDNYFDSDSIFISSDDNDGPIFDTGDFNHSINRLTS